MAAQSNSAATADSDLAIDVKELSFSFIPGQPPQLKDLTLSLPAKARCVIVGPNGAGKSTFLELLSGKKMAAANTVKVLGTDPFRGSSGSEVGLIQGGWRGGSSASDAIGEEKMAFMKVYQLLGLASPEVPTEGRPAKLFESLGLVPLINRYCGSLSDGERRKAELGRRLLVRKEVVLLDEATTDLDLLSRKSLLEFLAWDECTVLSVTHVFDGMEGWITHLALMKDGCFQRCQEVSSEDVQRGWAEAGGLFGLVSRWLAPDKDFLEPQSDDVETTGIAATVTDLKFQYAPWCPVALDINKLELRAGARYVLVGPNGAGKSSLLSVLAGRRMTKQGDIRVLGNFQPFSDHAALEGDLTILSSEWKRQVAEIGAGKSLSFKDLANSAMQDLVAKGAQMQDVAARMLKLIQILEIDPTKPLGALSDGMMRRVQIALKMLRPSKLLLVDEVTADLDVSSRQGLLKLLKEESKGGTCIVYCTHILDGLAWWATDILRLRPGGRPFELVQWTSETKGATGGEAAKKLYEIVISFLEEDAALPPVVVPDRPPASEGSGPTIELPSGWHSRAATQAGAYGSYAWNADKGSEDTWTFGSVAPPPPSLQQSMQLQQQAQQQQQQFLAQQQQPQTQAPAPFRMQSQFQQPQMFQQQAPFQQPFQQPPFQPQASPFGEQPFQQQQQQQQPQSQPLTSWAQEATPMPMPTTSQSSANDCPFGPGPRANAMTMEELVAKGILKG
mmetsp:Transcript_66941/g.139773  ORF Transcript_66941/g.139773 Transcript_66941/m.139773 type:complete len:731 (+) Transcript_66941:251-2443(+)|eukprot:CAMPEP_0206436386 /NCGR_PEP_ID=MMETSP0324_2-20121206/10448_1 /ASSEMBLY_ACC=CAM_ASM_000836 /TAXON_ID=2866 /ORGANISM="Crypthecodinium cohnii, Strain Seligo" /LENGTH=730 /DNA_ID=CAMNT_0053903533 /DNA_START=183 /DNA_END=2375 /DNA_ORIENTATION=+